MRRREPTADATTAAPAWLYRFRVEEWVDPDEVFLDEEGWLPPWFQRMCEGRRRWRNAGEKWCADRELSYAMTVLGWKRPASNEAAMGHVTGLPRPAGRSVPASGGSRGLSPSGTASRSPGGHPPPQVTP